ncbi:hypothetical protein [Prevotella sp. KH2C16]|uniref:hypothetical protein n=1 Tax=Prevotella sp. KH2C16 TaxID=1855325 RepID=UPI0011600C69|nr:hypothetical protein [Prevotella sp. KH2C16]
MTRKEFDKVSDRERKDVSKDFGWRQSGYLNWKITQGYYFAVFHLSLPEAYLTVKPLYVDDLWWDIFELPENKEAPKVCVETVPLPSADKESVPTMPLRVILPDSPRRP